MQPTISPIPPAPHLPSRPGDPAWEVAFLYPRQGQWTEAEYLALGTNRLVEFSDGCLEFLPMPTFFHQLLVEFLYTALKAFVTGRVGGKVLFAPLPVRLWPDKFREPDVVYLRSGRVRDVHGQPDGADLVMEVVSEGSENRDRDLNVKRSEYARAGIAEYWIVDPHESRVTVLVLDGTSYRVHGMFGAGTTAISVLLPGFAVAVDALFAAGQSVP
jgi:Uma2 family endonuclease